MMHTATASFCLASRRYGRSSTPYAKEAFLSAARVALPRIGAAVGGFFKNVGARFGQRAQSVGTAASTTVGSAPNVTRINFADLKPATNAAQQAGRTAAGATQQAARSPIGAPPPTPGAPRQNTFGNLAWNAVRGGLGFGPQQGATRTAQGVAHGAAFTTIGAPLAAGALGRGGDAQNPYQQQLGMQVTATDHGPAVYTVKSAFKAEKVRAGVDLASYGALAIPLVTKLLAPKFHDQHASLMHGLDAAGLAGLTSTGIYGIATGSKRDRANDALDVAGLGLMGLSLKRKLQEH